MIVIEFERITREVSNLDRSYAITKGQQLWIDCHLKFDVLFSKFKISLISKCEYLDRVSQSQKVIFLLLNLYFKTLYSTFIC